MVERLERDLLGPTSPDEQLQDLPLDRYIVGVLYPRISESIDPAEDDDLADAVNQEDPAYPHPPVALANTRYPSSAGLTFAVARGACDSILVDIAAARYSPVETESGKRWRREPSTIDRVPIDVTAPVSGQWKELGEGLSLFVKIRPVDDEGTASITLNIVNTREGHAGERDGDAFFQPSISVTAPDGADAFVERRSRHSDGGTRISAPTVCFTATPKLLLSATAVPRIGTATEPHRGPRGSSRRSCRVTSCCSATPTLRSSPLDSGCSFSHPPTAPRCERHLQDFCGLCPTWIDTRTGEIHQLASDLQPTAAEHLAACRECLGRMRDGARPAAGPARPRSGRAPPRRARRRPRHRARAGRPRPFPSPPSRPCSGRRAEPCCAARWRFPSTTTIPSRAPSKSPWPCTGPRTPPPASGPWSSTPAAPGCRGSATFPPSWACSPPASWPASTSWSSTPGGWGAAAPCCAARPARRLRARRRRGPCPIRSRARPQPSWRSSAATSPTRRRASSTAGPCCPSWGRSTRRATSTASARPSGTRPSRTSATPTAPCSAPCTPRCSPPTCAPWCSTGPSTPP